MKVNETETFEVYEFWCPRQDEPKAKRDFTLRIPKPPEDVGWFQVELNDGRKFTIFDMEELIDGYLRDAGDSEPGNLIDEGWYTEY